MSAKELATAVQHELPVVVLVVDNGMYGTIRMHQEREYPGRVSGTTLVNPDFAALARSFGAHGETVSGRRTSRAAFGRALAAGRPAVLHLPRGSRRDHAAHDADGASRGRARCLTS